MAKIKENLTYKNLYDTEENLWWLIYLTGYITKTPDIEHEKDTLFMLRIPNKEIFDFFTMTVEAFFRKKIKGIYSLKLLDLLFDAFWKRDDKNVYEILSALSLKTISFHDSDGVFLHAFLAGLFRRQYPYTTSNYERGLGRADIVIEDPNNKRAAVIEIKHSDSKEAMSASANDALRQIADMKYDVPLQRNYPVILHWGLACRDKSCIAKSVAG